MNEINRVCIQISNLNPTQFSRLEEFLTTLDADLYIATINGEGIMGDIIAEADAYEAETGGFDCYGCKYSNNCKYQTEYFNISRIASMSETDFIVSCPYFERDQYVED